MLRQHVVVAALVLSCRGFGADEADAPDGGLLARSPRVQACNALAEATCQRLEACAPLFARVSVGGSCVASLSEHCFRTAGLAGSKRDPGACARTVPGLSCDDLLSRYPDACVSPGLLANGVSCAFHEQCTSGLCARPEGSACGACAPAPVEAALGQPCSPTRACGRLLFCDVDRCATRKRLGDACAGLGQCDPFEVAVCNESFKCEAAKIAKLGEPCTFTANALTLCEAPARCINDRCTAAKREGERCGINGAHECEGFGADCIGGVCVRRTVEMCGQR